MRIESIRSFYKNCSEERTQFLARARESAELTLPYLIPPEGHNASTTFPTPFQGMGARGVNNLASKLLLALLPPNSPFFRLVVDYFAMANEGVDVAKVKSEIEESLAKVERAVQAEFETSNIRVAVFEALKHLIVSGNTLMYVPDDGNTRIYGLDSFVAKRDPSGTLLALATKETVTPDTLSDEVRALVAESESTIPSGDGYVKPKGLDLYTGVYREKNRWIVFQEINGVEVAGTRGTYPIGKNPFIPLRFTRIDGEHYGRGFIEEYLGDLRSLEGLTQAIVEGSAASAKVLFLVNPNGTTRLRTLSQSENGAIVQGNADDVSVLQVQKAADFKVAYDVIGMIKERLGFAFLMNTSVQRQAERVTAEEIRYMAQELEDVLGGVYSVLSQEFQLPLVNRVMDKMQKKRRLPKLPKKLIKPTIVTGLEALGRGHDLNKLDVFIQGAAQLLGPEFPTYVNMSDYLKRRATSIGIETAGLIKTAEEIEAEKQAQQQQAAMMQAAGPAINAVGKVTDTAAKGMQQQQQQ
jgi:hypothetical protein